MSMKLLADILGCTAETLMLFYLQQYFLKNSKVERKFLISVYLLDFFFCFTYSTLLHTRMSSTRQKKYNSEKQKTQATKMDLIAWVFRFCIFNYSKRSWIL